MTITITYGYWMIPLVITIFAFAAHLRVCWNEEPGYGGAIVGMFTFMTATVVSLFAWLVWAILT